MIGSSPIGSFPTSDFLEEVNFIRFSGTKGGIAGGTAMPVGRSNGYDGTAGAIGGGAATYSFGIGGQGYLIYGDNLYGDMPYLERQSAGVGGAIGGGSSDYKRIAVRKFEGGAIFGSMEIAYLRITGRDGTGGALAGGYGDEDGDFSKIVTIDFLLKWPEVWFVPPSERWDIPNLLKELE